MIVCSGYFEIVSALLEAKAAVNVISLISCMDFHSHCFIQVSDSDNDTPLHNATNGDHIKVDLFSRIPCSWKVSDTKTGSAAVIVGRGR